MALKKAKRQMLRLAMALIGPSGSGKTVGGLILAYGMMKEKYPDAKDEHIWSLIGLVDTEHERSLIYEGMEKGGVMIGQFWHYDLQAPYSVGRYEKAIMEMKEQGVEVVILDSVSHAWMGEGGVLDFHEQQGGGKFQSWNTTNKAAYFPLVSLITGESTQMHIINTVRAKQDHQVQMDAGGKLEIVKLGMQPVQRDQLEYEFQIALNIDMQNNARPSKDNSDIFKSHAGPVTAAQGAQLYNWLEKGEDIFAERRAAEQAAEKERLDLIKKIRAAEKKHSLHSDVQALEQHKAINMPLEQFDMDMLHKTMGVLEMKIKETAEAAKGAN